MNATPTGACPQSGKLTGAATAHNPEMPERRPPTPSDTPREEDHPFLSASTSMRPAAPASRTSGRYAVGLRPILDPDAFTGRVQKTAENKKKKDHTPKTGLDKTPPLQG